jgi:hypothetical protein
MVWHRYLFRSYSFAKNLEVQKLSVEFFGSLSRDPILHLSSSYTACINSQRTSTESGLLQPSS